MADSIRAATGNVGGSDVQVTQVTHSENAGMVEYGSAYVYQPRAWRSIVIAAEKRDDVTPLCPHCKAELVSVWYRQIATMLGRRYIYFCPACHCTLGVSHRKGFWMG
jgi:hypothetical protein